MRINRFGGIRPPYINLAQTCFRAEMTRFLTSCIAAKLEILNLTDLEQLSRYVFNF